MDDINLTTSTYFVIVCAFIFRTLQEIALSPKLDIPYAVIGIALCFAWPILVVIIFNVALVHRNELAHHSQFTRKRAHR